MKISESILRKRVRKILLSNVSAEAPTLQETGKRGFAYEETLINALESAGIDVTPAAGNNPSISDLGFEIDGKKIGAEVKLSHADNLGSIRKDNFDFLTWDGSTFSGSPSSKSEMPEVVDSLIAAMNSSDKAKSRFKELEKHIVQFKPLPWNLKSSFGYDAGDENERALYSIIRNEPERFPIPSGASPVKRKQIATPGDDVANIEQSTLMDIMSGKSAPNGANTSYVIVGYGKGSENTVAGQIYSLGADPLNIGAPIYTPGSIGVEIRFAGAGGGVDGRRYSLNFKTKATSGANAGIPFGNAEELVSILTRGSGRSANESLLRIYIKHLLS